MVATKIEMTDPCETLGEKIRAEMEGATDDISFRFVDASFDYEYGSIHGTHKAVEVEVDGTTEGKIVVSLTPEELEVIGDVGNSEWSEALEGYGDFSVKLTLTTLDREALVAGFTWEAYDFEPSMPEPDYPEPDYDRDYDDFGY